MGAIGRFGSDQRGVTGVIFGLALLPLMGAVGGAVDYGRAAMVQSKLQRATDAAALTIVKEPATTSQADLNTRAARIVTDLYGAADYVTLGAITVTRTKSSVTIDTSATVQNAFMQVVGYGQTAVRASSASTWGTQRIELALVLDNTGSMGETIGGQRKIDALKTSALKLLSDLRAIATDTDTVKVSIVPFDTEVRLDPGTYRNKDWFRWSAPSDRLAWTGYVYDRYGTYAASDDAPSLGVRNSLFPAPRDTEYHSSLSYQSTRDLSPMRALTSLYGYGDYNDLVSLVTGMQPRGFTNIALGASWGLASLTPSDPFTEGAPIGSAGVKKYMVILTDGKNTMNHVNGSQQSTVAPIDAQTSTVCSLVRSSKIELFTIRLLDGDTSLLKGCASGSDHYFDVQNSAQLTSAFRSIIDAISGTRLTN